MSAEAARTDLPPPASLEAPPDIRGDSSPFARSILTLGACGLALVLVGTIAIQIFYAVAHTPDPQVCLANGIIPYQPATASGPASGIQGWQGVCNIVLGLTSRAETAVLVTGIVLGVASLGIGLLSYRKADTR